VGIGGYFKTNESQTNKKVTDTACRIEKGKNKEEGFKYL
jgi:hypothetical protein